MKMSILAHRQNELIEDANLKTTKYTIEACPRHKIKTATRYLVKLEMAKRWPAIRPSS